MARMIPELDSEALERVPSKAERDTYRALQAHLGAEVIVVHSLELVAQAPHRGPTDSEADFVIFDPAKGFLAVEVKGGGIRFDATSRTWFSIDRNGIEWEIKDPFQQSRFAKHEILRILKGSHAWGPAGMPRVTIGHCVLFPDLLRVEQLGGPDRPSEIIGGQRSLENVSQWIEGVFDFWSRDSGTPQQFGNLGMSVVDQMFCHSVTVRVPLGLQIQREHRRQIELTTRQCRILRSLRLRPKASIAGAAGTGKTLLALEQAKTLASSGKLTLLVCYNRALSDFLKRECEGIENLHAMTFHQLCDWRIKATAHESGIDLKAEAALAYPKGSLFDVQLPFALARSTEVSSLRYDAIIVDEGQDFGDEYWLPIELILNGADNAQLYVFFDPNQAVYRNASTFPIHDAPFLLTENCRNTKPIHRVAYRFYSGEEVDPPDIEGAAPLVVATQGLVKQAQKLKHLVSELLTREEVGNSEIAVLVLDERKDRYYEALQNAGQPSGNRWSIETLWQPGTVLVDSVRRFKGLEAAVIILWGLEEMDLDRDKELLYVALSRAKSRIYILCDQAVLVSKGLDLS